ncbi:MAG: carbohydrate binding family 9 domain-containing protein [Gemmatimonadales bacterium]|nr:MAG: carbohydrate binding family 9 domain-containing protein [Gemmatimonadales bacterium]
MHRPFDSASRLAQSAVLAALLLPGGLVGQALEEELPSSLSVGREAPEAEGVVDLPRLSIPVRLDGRVDEAAWDAVQPIPLTMYEPTYRGETDRRIWLKLAYDDEALYVAARFYHDDPESIRAFTLTRDTWNGDDGFGLFLDTFHDKENAVRFVALPLGARMDMSISGDGLQERGTGGPQGSSWNTFWDLETEFLDDGWSGEMRIPFSSLRFETEPDGSVVMGLMTYAYEPGAEHRWTFPAIPRTESYTRVSAFQDVRMRGLEPRSPVYVTPYALLGRSRSWELTGVDDPATPDRWSALREDSREFGLDMKINPNPNLTLDLTLNTDFAAVEADQQQVNLTRFSLFFDEKRPFFQERAGIFGFETGTEQGTLFYSRRIGLADGVPVPILGGARLVGHLGSWDVGAIEMVTDEQGALPTENFGILRLRRRILNQNSFVGGMVTSRVASGGAYNHTYGLDGQFRLWGQEYLTLKWLQTVQGGTALRDSLPSGMDAGRIVVDWTRRRVEGFSYRNALVWSGPGYDPGMGFEERSDFVRTQSDWNYQWFPGEDAGLRRIWLGLESYAWVRNRDDQLETMVVEPFLQLEGKAGTTLILRGRSLYEDVLEAFDLSDDVLIPAGTYRATEAVVDFRAPRGWSIRPNVELTAGEFFDGTRLQVKNSFDWPFNRHLGLEGGWEWNRVWLTERGQEFDANLLRLTAKVAVDTHLSADIFGQYNSLTDQVTTNTRIRYNFREGQDLWLVWNEGTNLEQDVLGVPRVPRSDARTLTVKYTHTLVF